MYWHLQDACMQMKRVQPSGAENRKKKKAREEELNRSAGSLMKYMRRSNDTNRTPSDEALPETVDTENSDPQLAPHSAEHVVGAAVGTSAIAGGSSNIGESGENSDDCLSVDAVSDDGEGGISSSLRDVGSWPAEISLDL